MNWEVGCTLAQDGNGVVAADGLDVSTTKSLQQWFYLVFPGCLTALRYWHCTVPQTYPFGQPVSS